MTKEVLVDLSARFPYRVIVCLDYKDGTIVTREMGIGSFHDMLFGNTKGKPYLRQMSSMTEEEYKEYSKLWDLQDKFPTDADIRFKIDVFDWLNAHHFDYRGLIERGLALEAPEGMYNIKRRKL